MIGIWAGIIDGNTEFGKGYGTVSKDKQQPPTESTFFEIGSITKTFTALLLAKAHREGLVDLNDPVQTLLPEGVKAPEFNSETESGEPTGLLIPGPVRLWHLSSHTSGLPRMPDNFFPKNKMNPFVDYTPKDLYEFLNNHKLRWAPESQTEYSNLAVGLLGHLLALKYQKTYQQALIDEILTPLGLHDTRVRLNKEQQKRFADGHIFVEPTEHWTWEPTTALTGAGGLRSTGSDMMTYAKAQMGLLKTSLNQDMQLTQIKRIDRDEYTSIGLGWHIIKDGQIYIHNGGTFGFRTFMAFDKQRQKAVIILTNSFQLEEDGSVRRKLDEVGVRLLGE